MLPLPSAPQPGGQRGPPVTRSDPRHGGGARRLGGRGAQGAGRAVPVPAEGRGWRRWTPGSGRSGPGACTRPGWCPGGPGFFTQRAHHTRPNAGIPRNTPQTRPETRLQASGRPADHPSSRVRSGVTGKKRGCSALGSPFPSCSHGARTEGPRGALVMDSGRVTAALYPLSCHSRHYPAFTWF